MCAKRPFRIKTLLLCTLVVGLALPGFGQGRDTAFAVRKLFREKRASATGMCETSTQITAKNQYALQAESCPTAQKANQDALASAAFGTVGTLRGWRYSPEEEAYLLKYYAAGGSIPPAIRRKLKRRHFHRTARDLSAQ